MSRFRHNPGPGTDLPLVYTERPDTDRGVLRPVADRVPVPRRAWRRLPERGSKKRPVN